MHENPSIKKVKFMASCAAAGVPPSVRGGFIKCVTGLAILQKRSPIPIPALKSMANHERVLNSVLASFPPILIFPNLLKARYSTNIK